MIQIIIQSRGCWFLIFANVSETSFYFITQCHVFFFPKVKTKSENETKSWWMFVHFRRNYRHHRHLEQAEEAWEPKPWKFRLVSSTPLSPSRGLKICLAKFTRARDSVCVCARVRVRERWPQNAHPLERNRIFLRFSGDALGTLRTHCPLRISFYRAVFVRRGDKSARMHASPSPNYKKEERKKERKKEKTKNKRNTRSRGGILAQIPRIRLLFTLLVSERHFKVKIDPCEKVFQDRD